MLHGVRQVCRFTGWHGSGMAGGDEHRRLAQPSTLSLGFLPHLAHWVGPTRPPTHATQHQRTHPSTVPPTHPSLNARTPALVHAGLAQQSPSLGAEASRLCTSGARACEAHWTASSLDTHALTHPCGPPEPRRQAARVGLRRAPHHGAGAAGNWTASRLYGPAATAASQRARRHRAAGGAPTADAKVSGRRNAPGLTPSWLLHYSKQRVPGFTDSFAPSPLPLRSLFATALWLPLREVVVGDGKLRDAKPTIPLHSQSRAARQPCIWACCGA
jgi:hypothetical protein